MFILDFLFGRGFVCVLDVDKFGLKVGDFLVLKELNDMVFLKVVFFVVKEGSDDLVMFDELKVKVGEFDLLVLVGILKGVNINDWVVVGFVFVGIVNVFLLELDVVLLVIFVDDVLNVKGELFEFEFFILVIFFLSKNLNGKLFEVVCSVCILFFLNLICDLVVLVLIVFWLFFLSVKLKGKLFDVLFDVLRVLFVVVNVVFVLIFLIVNGLLGEGFFCKLIGEINWKLDLEVLGEIDVFFFDNLVVL